MKPTAAHLVTRAARNYGASRVARWRFCFYAYKVVGRYEEGATLALADAIRRSVDTVENGAHAAGMYFTLCQLLPRHSRTIRNLIRHLDYLHFLRVYRVWKREEFSPMQAMRYLVEAMEQNLSPEKLDMLIDADYPSPKPRPALLPVFGIQDGTIERLRAEMPGAFVLILPLVDDWKAGDEAKVTKVRKSK